MTSAVAPLATVKLDLQPRWVAITPDGRLAYVTMDDHLPGGDSIAAVAVIDTPSNTVTATIPIGIQPGDVAITPDGQQVYVSNFDRPHLSGALSAIDTLTNTVTASITVSGRGGGPTGVAVGLNGRHAYVCNDMDEGHDQGRLSVIDTSTNTITTTIGVSAFPTAVRITPDGRRVYVIDTDGTFAIIDTATNEATFPFTNFVGHRMAFAGGGSHAYILRDADTLISVVDTSNIEVVNFSDVNGLATDVAVTPDGQHAYVTQRTASLISVIDTTTHVATPTPVAFQGTADGLAITPDGQRAYVSNRRARTVEVIAIPPTR
jgi:YVTN family beta-propeller protein